MLGKIAGAGQNGQFRTPRRVIRLMVEMTAPQPTDIICDPACGTCGFLVAAGESLREKHPESLRDAKLRKPFHHGLFHGFDSDNTMLRIGSMNILLHGVENPDITYRDSLAQDHAGEDEKYTLVLANAPFAGSLDYENTAKDLLQVVKTKKRPRGVHRAAGGGTGVGADRDPRERGGIAWSIAKVSHPRSLAVRRSCLLTGPWEGVIFVVMVIATGKVVDGRVELDTELPEGASVTVLAREGDETLEADPATERMLLDAIAQCERGDTIPMAELLGEGRGVSR